MALHTVRSSHNFIHTLCNVDYSSHQLSTDNACASGAGAGDVSLVTVANEGVGLAEVFVHARSWSQLATAALAAEPVRGWGRSSTMIAGRQVT